MGNYCIGSFPINDMRQSTGICTDVVHGWLSFVVAIRLRNANFFIFKVIPERVFEFARFSAKVAKSAHR